MLPFVAPHLSLPGAFAAAGQSERSSTPYLPTLFSPLNHQAKSHAAYFWAFVFIVFPTMRCAVIMPFSALGQR